MEFVKTNVEALAVLAALTGTDGLFEDAQVRLFQNDVQPIQTSVIGDFTVPDYTGYADQTIAWNDPSIADDGTPEVIGIVPEFRPTDAVTPNSVYGALLITAADALLEGGRFEDAPLPMESASDQITITVRLRFTADSIGVVIS